MAVAAILDRENPLTSGSPLGWLEEPGLVRAPRRRLREPRARRRLAAFAIRKIQRPRRFEGSHLGEADLILGLIAAIVTSLLLWHATLIALDLNPWPAGWSPVSNALSGLFADDTTDRRCSSASSSGRTSS